MGDNAENFHKMKKLLFILCFGMISCINQYSKRNHRNTINLTEGLFLEIYKVSGGGVFASDTYSHYLTDSLTFRKFIGCEFDDERILLPTMNKDTIIICKVDFYTSDTLEIQVYNLPLLKKEGKFE